LTSSAIAVPPVAGAASSVTDIPRVKWEWVAGS